MTPFLLCSYFRAHPTTLLLKILGGRMHGPPHLKFLGGPSPQVSACAPVPYNPPLTSLPFLPLQEHVDQLQSVLNAAARLIGGIPKFVHISEFIRAELRAAYAQAHCL